MNKPFKTYKQQLRILRGRNLIISNGSRAIRILKREGYYNIINGYKEIFLDANMTRQHQGDYYKNGTEFEHIAALYDFDRELRSVLLKYILKVEKYLKTTAVQNACQHENNRKCDYNVASNVKQCVNRSAGPDDKQQQSDCQTGQLDAKTQLLVGAEQNA